MIVCIIVKFIQDIMCQDVGVDGDVQCISQFIWLFFFKIIDDQDQEFEIMWDDYYLFIFECFQWWNWVVDLEGIIGQVMFDFVNDELFFVFKGFQVLVKLGDCCRVVCDVFEDVYNYMKFGQLFWQVVNKINQVDFNNFDECCYFGEFYE